MAKQIVLRFGRAENGTTAIEYALLASLISVSIILGITAIGPQLSQNFENVVAGFSPESDVAYSAPDSAGDKTCTQAHQNCRK